MDVSKGRCPNVNRPFTQCAVCVRKQLKCEWRPHKTQPPELAGLAAVDQAGQGELSTADGDLGAEAADARPTLPPNGRKGLTKLSKQKDVGSQGDVHDTAAREEQDKGPVTRPSRSRGEDGSNLLAQETSDGDEDSPADLAAEMKTRQIKKRVFQESAHIRAKQKQATSSKRVRYAASPSSSSLSSASSVSSDSDDAAVGFSQTRIPKHPEAGPSKQKHPVPEPSHSALKPDRAIIPKKAKASFAAVPASPSPASPTPPAVATALPGNITRDPPVQPEAGPSKPAKLQQEGIKRNKRIIESDEEDEDETEAGPSTVMPNIAEDVDPEAKENDVYHTNVGKVKKIVLKLPSRAGNGDDADGKRPKLKRAGSGDTRRTESEPDREEAPRTGSPESRKSKRADKEKMIAKGDPENRDRSAEGEVVGENKDQAHPRKRHKPNKDRLGALRAVSTGPGSSKLESNPSSPSGSGSNTPPPETPRRFNPDAMYVVDQPSSASTPAPVPKSAMSTAATAAATGTPKEVRPRIPKKALGVKPPVDDLLTALFKQSSGTGMASVQSGSSTPARLSSSQGSKEHAFAAVERQEQATRRAAIKAKQVVLNVMASGYSIRRFESDPLNFPSRSMIYNPTTESSERDFPPRSANGYGGSGGSSYGHGRGHDHRDTNGYGTGNGTDGRYRPRHGFDPSQGLPYDGLPPPPLHHAPPPPTGPSVKLSKSVEVVRRLLAMRDVGMLGV